MSNRQLPSSLHEGWDDMKMSVEEIESLAKTTVKLVKEGTLIDAADQGKAQMILVKTADNLRKVNNMFRSSTVSSSQSGTSSGSNSYEGGEDKIEVSLFI